ncbi:MAG: sigma-70 family RNA polymerase sigma factor [Rhodothermales bacterium]
MQAETPRRPQADVPEQELIDRLRAGDRRAFRDLIGRHQDHVTFTVVSMIGRTEEVDDVVQDVFVRFYESLDRYRGDASLTTYLKRIAVNRSLDALRRRKRWQLRFTSRDDERHPLPEPVSEDARGIEHTERAALVHRAIATLPDKHKAVVVLRLLEGYSTEETADMLQIAYGTVLSRLSRATSTLKHALQGLLHDAR